MMARLRHALRLPCAVALVVLGLAASALAAEPALDSWLNARAQEYEAFLHPRSPERGTGSGQLWRERPSGSHLPEFAPPTSLAPLIRAVRPGVANISAWNTNPQAPPEASKGGRSLGSGFIISPDGYVVTNNHVVERAQRIQVKLADGQDFLAETVGRDPSTDVALLRLLGVTRDLPFAYLGDSDSLEVGDWVVAIGNPFGLDYTVSQGIISAKERVIGISAFDDFLQIDALINPGNSGGPLFNMRGEVVGVTTAIFSQGQGIGFAVPINMVKDLLPNLRINGHLERGWLGINIRDSQGLEKGTRGAVVLDVFAGGPAAAAGLQPGDRLTAVNGRSIETYLQLLRRVALLPPGQEAKFTVVRGSSTREVKVKLGARPAPEALQAQPGGPMGPWGLALRELTPEVAEGLQVPAYSGVLVSSVSPGTPGAQAGLAPGDLITEVNNRRVQDLRSLQAAMERTGSRQAALVRFQRGEQDRYVAVGP